MKKRLAAVIFLTSLLLTGCAPVKEDVVIQEGQESMFTTVEQTYNWKVVYDKDTKVMYAVSYAGNREFTMLVNADGSPKLWKGDSSGKDTI